MTGYPIIKAKRSSTKTISPITITDGNGNAQDITGYTVYFFVKKKPDSDINDTAALISKSITSHTSDTGGITAVELTLSDLRFDPGEYIYDVLVKDTSDNVHPVLAEPGKFVLYETAGNGVD